MQQAARNLKPEDQCDSILDSFPPSSLLLTFLCDYITIPHQCSDISLPTLCVHYWPWGSKQQGHGVQRPKQAGGLHLNIKGVEEKDASIQPSRSRKRSDVFSGQRMTSRHTNTKITVLEKSMSDRKEDASNLYCWSDSVTIKVTYGIWSVYTLFNTYNKLYSNDDI